MRHSSDRIPPAVVTAIVALAAVLVAAASHAAPDTGALIARLARPAPASISFLEVRFSTLLTEPLVVGGTLVYEGEGSLTRRVETPYREESAIRGETVRVERDGEEPRTFALRRAPELRGLLTSMIGLLAGNASFIGEHFAASTSGDDQRWRLDLAPTDGRLVQRLSEIVVAGRAAEPHCFVIRQVQGGASVMLLGAAAAQPLPAPLALPELLAHCGAE
jgi:hypothetical protein